MSTEVKPSDWNEGDNRWKPTPGGGGSFPTPTADDNGKVLTAGADGTASWQTASGGGIPTADNSTIGATLHAGIKTEATSGSVKTLCDKSATFVLSDGEYHSRIILSVDTTDDTVDVMPNYDTMWLYPYLDIQFGTDTPIRCAADAVNESNTATRAYINTNEDITIDFASVGEVDVYILENVGTVNVKITAPSYAVSYPTYWGFDSNL